MRPCACRLRRERRPRSDSKEEATALPQRAIHAYCAGAGESAIWRLRTGAVPSAQNQKYILMLILLHKRYEDMRDVHVCHPVDFRSISSTSGSPRYLHSTTS